MNHAKSALKATTMLQRFIQKDEIDFSMIETIHAYGGLLLKPEPGPWTWTQKNLDPKKPGPRKTWTLKNLDPEKPGL